jgi:membrane protease YdiL (CAAX protease family)
MFMMKEFLDRFATIAAILTFAIVALSVSHEYGYFWAVGQQFQAFVTPSDYFANATLWLPATILSIWGMINWRQLRTPELPSKTNWKSWIVPFLVFVGGPLVWFFYGPVWSASAPAR